jgi:hypothetical protein
MKAILSSESYRTGQNVIKLYNFSDPVSYPGLDEKFESLELHYDTDKKTCTVSPLNFTDPVTDEPNISVIFSIDLDSQNPLLTSTDKYIIKEFLGRSNYLKLQVESDSSIFEDY